jgi:hypothetical protein
MARKNFTFEKRRRELDKKAKKEARKQLKAEHKAQVALGTPNLSEVSPGEEFATPETIESDADPRR